MALTRETFNILKLYNSSGFPKISNVLSYKSPNFVVPSRTTKHRDPKFRWLRSKKVLDIDLDAFTANPTKEQLRSRLKSLGISPPRYWRQRPMTINSLNEIIDPFQPPEADGKASIISKNKMKAIVGSVKEKYDDIQAIRKIKSYDSSFSSKVFPQEAHDLYVKVHHLLMNKNPEELSEYVTERALMEMMDGLKNLTLKWKFIESLEPPIVLQTRAAPALTESNLFAQITVRFHTKQMLAVYDRFGRLFYGSEILEKDVLEYVVFEKHIVNEYGTWRLHGKIIPEWKDASEYSVRTFRVPEVEEEIDDPDNFVEEDQDLSTRDEILKKDNSTIQQ